MKILFVCTGVPDIYEYMNVDHINIIREKTDAWLNEKKRKIV